MDILKRNAPGITKLHDVVVKARYELNSSRSRIETQRIALTGALQYMDPMSKEAIRCHSVISRCVMMLEIYDMPEEELAELTDITFVPYEEESNE
jgi:hypothetical protein